MVRIFIDERVWLGQVGSNGTTCFFKGVVSQALAIAFSCTFVSSDNACFGDDIFNTEQDEMRSFANAGATFGRLRAGYLNSIDMLYV